MGLSWSGSACIYFLFASQGVKGWVSFAGVVYERGFSQGGNELVGSRDLKVKDRVTRKLQESHATRVKGQVTEQCGVT